MCVCGRNAKCGQHASSARRSVLAELHAITSGGTVGGAAPYGHRPRIPGQHRAGHGGRVDQHVGYDPKAHGRAGMYAGIVKQQATAYIRHVGLPL